MSKCYIVILTVMVMLAACRSDKTGSASLPIDTEGDSLVAEASAPSPQEEMERMLLPDTTYASAADVVYTIENDDSLEHPLLDFTDRYDRTDRVMTFRRNLRRDASFAGRVEGTPTTIEVAWTFTTPLGENARWGGGTGWTGQPLYAHWTDEEVARMREGGAPLTDDFAAEEVFVGSLCGKAFFLNFLTGRPSRQPLDLHNLVKGTMSLDPEMLNLYVGQGINMNEPIGCEAFDLTNHQRGFFMHDSKAWRGWNAFDSSPIVAGGYLFWAAENGSLYKFERLEGGQLRRISTLRYKVNGAAPGIESSLCVYRNYGFFADNHGNVMCVNLNTMRPVWHYKNHDDTDGTIVCREEDGVPYVYTACEVDKQGRVGTCHFLKLKALTGEVVWEQPIACHRVELPDKILDGGMYSTPLLGQGNCSDMIFANICRNGASPSKGELTAISTADGSVVYTVPYGNFCWSSPVAFLNENDEMFIFTGDANGVAYLIRAKDGEVLCRKQMGANFESSPCVVGHAAVVGCRGNKIHKFVIK